MLINYVTDLGSFQAKEVCLRDSRSKGGRVPVEPLSPAFPCYSLMASRSAFPRSCTTFFLLCSKICVPDNKKKNNFPSTVKKCLCFFQYRGLRENNLFKLREHDKHFVMYNLLLVLSVTYSFHFHIYL